MTTQPKSTEEKTKDTLPDPVEAILFRMEQYEHVASETSRITGIGKSHLSEILNRKRKLSLGMIRKFAAYGVPLKVLVQEYKL